jgi:hypothetical protein
LPAPQTVAAFELPQLDDDRNHIHRNGHEESLSNQDATLCTELSRQETRQGADPLREYPTEMFAARDHHSQLSLPSAAWSSHRGLECAQDRPMVELVTIVFEMRCTLGILRCRCNADPGAGLLLAWRLGRRQATDMKALRADQDNHVARRNHGRRQTSDFMISDSNNGVLIVIQLCIPYELFICLWSPRTLTLAL